MICSNSNYVVALAAFWVNFFLLGVLRSNAVIYSALVDVFGINRQHAAWPSGIFGFCMSVTGAISGILTNYWSVRRLAIFGALLSAFSVSICCLATEVKHIIIFYGALQGIGFGLIVPLTHVALNQNYSKYRACAMGIAYSGSSLGSFVYPPLVNYLIKVYNLHGTFLILGGIMLNALLGAMLFRTPKALQLQNINAKNFWGSLFRIQLKEESPKESKTSEFITSSEPVNNEASSHVECYQHCENFCKNQAVVSAIEILTSHYFVIISIAYASYFTSSAVFLMVILDFAADRGITENEGVFFVSAYSIGDLAGRLSSGWIADLQIVRRSTLVRLYLIIMGLLLSIFTVLPNNGFMVVSVALGIISGCLIVNHSVLLNEYLGLPKLPMSMGFATCIVGFSAFLRPIIIGYFRDYYQSYNMLFAFLGIFQMSIAVIWFLELIVPLVSAKFSPSQSVANKIT